MPLIQFDSTFKSKSPAEAFGLSAHLGFDATFFIDEKVSDCTVYWSLDPDMRERGIKSMGLSIDSVSAIISWEKEIEQDQEPVTGEVAFDTQHIAFAGWNIINEVKFQEDGSVGIENVSFDFAKKEVTVS